MKQTRGAVRTRAAPVRLHAPELAAGETMLAQANIVTTIVPTRVVVERIGIVMLGLDTFSEEPASTTITPQMTVERLFNATVSRVKWASTLIVVAGAVKELARRVQCVQPTTFVKIASDCPRANVRYVKGTVDLGITVRTAYLNQGTCTACAECPDPAYKRTQCTGTNPGECVECADGYYMSKTSNKCIKLSVAGGPGKDRKGSSVTSCSDETDNIEGICCRREVRV